MDAHTRSLIEDAREQLRLAHAAHEASKPSIQHVRNAERMLDMLLARRAEAQPKFAETFCSQCGGAFGPGDHGYSHCDDHRPAQPIAVMLDAIGGRRS